MRNHCPITATEEENKTTIVDKETNKQLELDLWGDLRMVLKSPEAADIQLLWQGLEDAIAPLDRNGQLQMAGDAIAQIVEIHIMRANGNQLRQRELFD